LQAPDRVRHEHSVLVVDDDLQTRSALAELLRENGLKAHRARNGREAIRKLRSRRKPCLILLDLMMPGMTGWEFLEFHRGPHVLSSVPVVLVTGWVDTDIAQAKALISKPIEPRRLLRRLKRLLGQERRDGKPDRSAAVRARKGSRRAQP
jgi:CheY-like chemotaxis protein